MTKSRAAAASQNEAQEVPTNIEGWDWFKAQEATAQHAAKQEGIDPEDLTLAFQKTFSTPSGKVVLAHLERMMENFKDFDPELGFYNGAAFGFWRSGQRSMVTFIKTMQRRK